MLFSRRVRIQPSGDDVFDQGIAAIQQQLKLQPDFPPAVEAAASAAAANVKLPDLDRTDIPLVTIDPPESTDLDQAMALERSAGGYRVYYAIADVASFVAAGDPLDVEANKRGETMYGADSRILLYPAPLTEGATSLLQDQVRPAVLWTIDLDKTGEISAIDVRRGRVKSRQKCDYAGVQQQLDAGTADPVWTLLREIGQLRQQLERARGGVSLNLPEQEISRSGGQWQIEYRANHPVEDWNAQISLLTGMAAARLMVQAKVGILRTLPPPDAPSIQRLRLTAQALGIAWPDGRNYPDFIRALDPAQPKQVAMMMACTAVLRGAAYAAFDGALPAQPMHSAIAAEYAHCTAPMRRLVDRYVSEVCIALCARQPVPQWALDALPKLPDTMAASDRISHEYERAITDLTEAVIMAPHVGATYPGTIVELNHPRNGGANEGLVMLRDPAIEAHVDANGGALQLGSEVNVRLTRADPVQRAIRFELAQ